MTDHLPSWVQSVLTIEGLGFVDTDSSLESCVPHSSRACPLVSPLSSKEPAGLALHRCLIQIRRIESALRTTRWAEWWTQPREKFWRGSPYTSFEGTIEIWDGPSFYCNKCSMVVWERCRECEREKARWLRAKALAKDLTAVSRFLGKSIRFVTLTIPNVDDPSQGIKKMKKMVRDLRRRVGFKAHVVGGSDFYEYTERDGSFNVHHHGLWIGDYWSHEHLTETWGEGHVWITAIRRGQRGTRRMVGYAVKYTTKQAELGIKARQRFGCLYGRAFAELDCHLNAV